MGDLCLPGRSVVVVPCDKVGEFVGDGVEWGTPGVTDADPVRGPVPGTLTGW